MLLIFTTPVLGYRLIRHLQISSAKLTGEDSEGKKQVTRKSNPMAVKERTSFKLTQHCTACMEAMDENDGFMLIKRDLYGSEKS